jgi:long-chain-fatty-acyl-CoA reductase
MPVVVNGVRVSEQGGEAVEPIDLAGDLGATVAVPRLDSRMVGDIIALDRGLLANLSLQDIVAFLDRAGRNWKSDQYARRRLYVRQLQDVMGYSEAAALAEADWIGIVLTAHSRMYDQVETELGSRFILDDWVRREEAYVRAFPLGRTVHLLVGNVPVSSVVSIVRALVTKNLCVAKLASTDPITPVSLALSFLDVDPQHPVTRALSVVYWPHDDPLGTELVRTADAVCAWGGRDAVDWARRQTATEASFVLFGPKRSVALVGRAADRTQAARALAHDVCAYDQRACFSVQQVFVEGLDQAFVESIEHALDDYREILPLGRQSFDQAAAVSIARVEELFLDSQVLVDDHRSWTLVVRPPGPVLNHPQGRTLYVHPVDRLQEALPFLGPDVQTVAAAPWEVLTGLRDRIAATGVSRMVELGLNNVFRIGGAHDGLYPLNRLVRYASVEVPAAVHGKGMVIPIDQTELLRAGTVRTLFL